MVPLVGQKHSFTLSFHILNIAQICKKQTALHCFFATNCKEMNFSICCPHSEIQPPKLKNHSAPTY